MCLLYGRDSALAHKLEDFLSVFAVPGRCSHNFGLSRFGAGPQGVEGRELA